MAINAAFYAVIKVLKSLQLIFFHVTFVFMKKVSV